MHTLDPFTLDLRLCDDAGLVSHEAVPFGELGTTYLARHNRLCNTTFGDVAHVSHPFGCTGHAHLMGHHIRCTSPAHAAPVRTTATPCLRILFDGPPAHESGRFVECENAAGASVSCGEWTEEGPYWVLTVRELPGAAPDLLTAAKRMLDHASHADACLPVPADLGRVCVCGMDELRAAIAKAEGATT